MGGKNRTLIGGLGNHCLTIRRRPYWSGSPGIAPDAQGPGTRVDTKNLGAA